MSNNHETKCIKIWYISITGIHAELIKRWNNSALYFPVLSFSWKTFHMHLNVLRGDFWRNKSSILETLLPEENPLKLNWSEQCMTLSSPLYSILMSITFQNNLKSYFHVDVSSLYCLQCVSKYGKPLYILNHRK